MLVGCRSVCRISFNPPGSCPQRLRSNAEKCGGASKAARSGRHGTRDYAMMLTTFRHGLRVSELCDLHVNDVNMETARMFVRRKKNSLSTYQPIEGDELRAVRAWTIIRNEREDAASSYLCLSKLPPERGCSVASHLIPYGIRRDFIWRTKGSTPD